MQKRVALLDAGAQLEKVIMRRVLEQGYEVDKFPVNVPASQIYDYDSIILSGGPKSVFDSDALLPDPDIYRLGKPILGICYGMQAIAHQLGHGRGVGRGREGQYGRSYVHIETPGRLFSGLPENQRVLMSHFDTVNQPPHGFIIQATSGGNIAAIGDESRQIYGVQFHPELIPITEHGQEIFHNFFSSICHFPEQYGRAIDAEINHCKKIIHEAVGSDKYIMHYLSGGVDSTVMASLLNLAIEPDRLFMRTLDTGTMRWGEMNEVSELARKLELPNFEVMLVGKEFNNFSGKINIQGQEVMAGPMSSTIDPEIKRKLFGTCYAELALKEMHNISEQMGIPFENFLLGQGTLRPDLIESGHESVTMGQADTIKTHHNAVEALKYVPKLEPLVELFKDQVREIGIWLGLDRATAYRQPFPGPGLYCRIIGSTGAIPPGLEALDKKVKDKYGLNIHPLPIKTVGVQGDERSYKHPAIVSGDISWGALQELILTLPNEVREINRVLYTPGPELTLEECIGLTPTFMTDESIFQAQGADMVMRKIAHEYRPNGLSFNDSRVCSQMPGILIPCNFGQPGKRSFVVRPVYTHDFMALIGMLPEAANPKEAIPEDMFLQMAGEIPARYPETCRVILDATDKPPASTEWE